MSKNEYQFNDFAPINLNDLNGVGVHSTVRSPDNNHHFNSVYIPT